MKGPGGVDDVCAIDPLRYMDGTFSSALHFPSLYILFSIRSLPGLFWHRLVFTAHDAAYMDIIHMFHTDTWITYNLHSRFPAWASSIGRWKRDHSIYPSRSLVVIRIWIWIEQMPFSSSRTYYDRGMSFTATLWLHIKYRD